MRDSDYRLLSASGVRMEPVGEAWCKDIRSGCGNSLDEVGFTPLELDHTFIGTLRPSELDKRLAYHFASTAHEIASDRRSVRLLGQNRSHHLADRELLERIGDYGLDSPGEIGAFRKRIGPMALTFEDSWSGWFIARTLARMSDGEPLVVLHLDDHRDLMPSLLCRDALGAVVNPVTRTVFDPSSAADWELAIATGVVNIGTWLTALVIGASCAKSGRCVHVRHLHPEGGSSQDSALCTLRPEFHRHRLFPDLSFGQVTFAPGCDAQQGSTFHASSDLRDLMHDLPEGRVILHVDLDFFVNDFNGNLEGSHDIPTEGLPDGAAQRLTQLQDLIGQSVGRIEDVVLATSPGFCASRRWPHLVTTIEEMLTRNLEGSE